MSTHSFATTWTVDDDGLDSPFSDFDNIQDAINAAVDGDIVLVYPGTYTSTGTQVVNMLGKEILLQSATFASETIIDGEGTRTGIYCNSDETLKTTIDGFTITNCNGNAGGGVYCWQADPTIRECVFYYNHTNSGGAGINCGHSSPWIENCSFVGNTASGSGGGIDCSSGSPVLLNCSFEYNTATTGAGIYCSLSSPTLTGCSFLSNWASLRGGGVMCNQLSGPTLTDCTFTLNTAPTGGGMYNWESSPNLKGCLFNYNTATDGAALASSYSDIVLTGCEFVGNEATGLGGGVFNDNSAATVTTCLFQWNASNVGGGIYNRNSPVVVSDSTFESNSATTLNLYEGGGGMYNIGSAISMTSCTFNNNQAQSGGAMECFVTNASILNSIFTNNSAQVRGGGFYCKISDVVIDDTVLDNNIAAEGDGFYVGLQTTLNFEGTNSTDEIYPYQHVNSNSRLEFVTDAYCYVTSNVTTPYGGSTNFDINNLVADETLKVGGEINRGGALGVSNDSNSLFAANVGVIVPLVQASTLTGSFSSVTLPAMPDGLGLQLIEQEAPRGADTEIAVEVIEVEGANFSDPFESDVDSPPVDIESFDANGDGVDELVVLFGGSPGSVVIYSVSEVGSPTEIVGYTASVGNEPVDLDVGDLDGDGLDDVIVSNGDSNTLSVLTTNLAGDGTLTFNAEIIIPLGTASTCVAIIDWDDDADLDVVAGIDTADPSLKDGYQVILDVAGASSSGPWIQIPKYLLVDVLVPNPPTCVDGRPQIGPWGFVGGTQYGLIHRVDTAVTLQVVGEVGAAVVTIELVELDASPGDDQIDLMASSTEAQLVYLFQGSDGEADDFEDMIPIAVSEPVVDVVAIDADFDGDMDIVLSAPESTTPLVLLRNDGASARIIGSLTGLTWSKQNMNAGTALGPITSGGLNSKNEDDDWLIKGGNPVTVRGNKVGTLEQTNLLGEINICIADITADGQVDIEDLLMVIDQFGANDPTADVNGDGIVDISDLLEVVGSWGPCL